jgi:GLPGLI family protein
MKKIITTAAGIFLFAIVSIAQQTQGKVIYERTSQMQFSFAGMPGGMEHQMPKTRTDKFELSFGNNQSLWKQAEKENSDDDGTFTSSNGGAQIRMVVAGNDDVLYNNFDKIPVGSRSHRRHPTVSAAPTIIPDRAPARLVRCQ